MLANSAELHFQYLCDDKTAVAGHPLAKIVFDARCARSPEQEYISTGLPLLQTELETEPLSIYEVISSSAPINQGRSANSYWAETDSCLLLAFWVKEADAGGLQNATETLYSQLLSDMQARGYPHLVRVWNYFADINRVDQGLERYRQFCIGRFDAFAAQQIDESQFPSACALGHSGGDLLIYAIASKVAPQHFENPRQASAYHYPSQYGPRSPSFARASLLQLPGQPATLYISGTASVVGFVTQHPDNLSLQIEATIANLNYLLTHVSEDNAARNGGIAPTLSINVLKIYVRHPQDLAEIEGKISQAYPQAPAVYVLADICRADLLLEIDGIWQLGS